MPERRNDKADANRKPVRNRARPSAGKKRMEYLRALVIIHGIVQGVFFRAGTRDEAIRVGVGGWVRNLPDGTVEALFEGEKKKVEEILGWCHKGPSGAQESKGDVF